MLHIMDEFTHEHLAIPVSRRLKSIDVIDALSDLFILRGVLAHIHSDNGPEFIAKAVQNWIGAVVVGVESNPGAHPLLFWQARMYTDLRESLRRQFGFASNSDNGSALLDLVQCGER